jgi:hypothetical protein
VTYCKDAPGPVGSRPQSAFHSNRIPKFDGLIKPGAKQPR